MQEEAELKGGKERFEGQGLGGPRDNRPDKHVMEKFSLGSDNALDMTLRLLGLYFGR
jgi:hypothetical protein